MKTNLKPSSEDARRTRGNGNHIAKMAKTQKITKISMGNHTESFDAALDSKVRTKGSRGGM